MPVSTPLKNGKSTRRTTKIVSPGSAGQETFGVKDWSWSTLISSLLSSKHLSVAVARYHWNVESWRLDEEKWEHLKSVLERDTLPMEVMRYHEYRSRSGPERVVFYVHQMGTSGSPCAGISITSELRYRPDAVVKSSYPDLDSTGQSFDTPRFTEQSLQAQFNFEISTYPSSSFTANSPQPSEGLLEQIPTSTAFSSHGITQQFDKARHLASDQIRATLDQTFYVPQGRNVNGAFATRCTADGPEPRGTACIPIAVISTVDNQ